MTLVGRCLMGAVPSSVESSLDPCHRMIQVFQLAGTQDDVNPTNSSASTNIFGRLSGYQVVNSSKPSFLEITERAHSTSSSFDDHSEVLLQLTSLDQSNQWTARFQFRLSLKRRCKHWSFFGISVSHSKLAPPRRLRREYCQVTAPVPELLQ